MGQCTTECTLKKFLVHFRRPQDYYGQYGFDWLRQSYVEAIVRVQLSATKSAVKPLCMNPNNLKKEYKKDVKNPIAPYGKEYFPAWLSLFASIPGKNKNVSNMTRSGATLDLYIENLEPLEADNTVLKFVCNNKFVKISPSTISLASALTKPKITDPDGNKTYYHLPKVVNIRCEGGWLDGHTEVKVIAKNGNNEMEVGKLMLYDNRIVKRAEIIVISLITDSKNKVVPKVKDYEHFLKKRSFNQALVRAEIIKEKIIDMTNSQNSPLASWNKSGLPTNLEIFRDKLRQLFNQTPELTKEFGVLDNNGKCTKESEDKNCIDRTVLFLTTHDVITSDGARARGVCSQNNDTSLGDMVIIFKEGLNLPRTYAHELAHSFGLWHTFDSPERKHVFYQGTLDNFMDYTHGVNGDNKKFIKGNMSPFNFYKWQWDIMRKDKSMK